MTTTCTHKQLFGPRGGLIMSGQDADSPAPKGTGTLADFLQRAIFPYSQGAPVMNVIAAKARALRRLGTSEFRRLAERIVANAQAIAHQLAARTYTVVSGGTDNHIVLIDVSPRGLTGLAAQQMLEDCDIVVNKNQVPHDTTSAFITSGIRIGTNGIAARGMGLAEARRCAELLDEVLDAAVAVPGDPPRLPREVRDRVRDQVHELCTSFPIPGYPVSDLAEAAHD